MNRPQFQNGQPGPGYEPAGIPHPPVLGLRVLVAEDEAPVREVLGIYLAEDSHRVVLVANGMEALLKLREAKFDLLITDHAMPGADGERVAREARLRSPRPRIVLLTGLGETAPGGARRLADALVCKPFTFETLREGIARAMDPRTMG